MEIASTKKDAPRSIRFGLKTLLLVTGYCCFLLVPFQWFGVAYLVSAAISSLLVFGCHWFYRKQEIGTTIGIAAIGALLGVMCGIGSITFLMHGVANFVAIILGGGLRLPPRGMVALLVVVALGVYGFAFKSSYDEFLQITELRKQYPIVSVANRLEFEAMPRQTGDLDANGAGTLAPAVLKQLDERELKPRRTYRRSMLERLHHDNTRQFVSAAGFGFIRMAYVTPRSLELDPRPVFAPGLVQSKVEDPVELYAEGQEFHELVLTDYLDPETFGYVAAPKTVAGFEPHALRTVRQATEPRDELFDWEISRLELVSLLRHNPPRVYVSEEMPAMDQLTEYPHRELNEFESASLPQLVSQEDLVIKRIADRMVMLGSLRASNDCLECHSGQRGDLLGAFSYELANLAEKRISE